MHGAGLGSAFDFNPPGETVRVSRLAVFERVVCGKSRGERFGIGVLDGVAERAVGGTAGQLVSLDERMNVKSGSSADDGDSAERFELENRGLGVAHEICERVGLRFSGVDDVEQTRHDRLAAGAVFLQILSGADVESAIDLAGIRGDDRAAESACEGDGERRFPARGRTENDDDFSAHWTPPLSRSASRHSMVSPL